MQKCVIASAGYKCVRCLGILPYSLQFVSTDRAVYMLPRFLVGEGARAWAKSKGILVGTMEENIEVGFLFFVPQYNLTIQFSISM